MNYKLIYIVLVILPLYETKRKLRSVYFIDTKSDINEKYIKNLEIDISPKRDSMKILIEIVQDISDVWATVGVGRWQTSTKNFRSMFSYHIDLCDTLLRLKTAQLPLLNKWITNFLKYGNISSQCPFYKSVYYLNNLKVDKDSIPEFVPAGKYQTYLSLYRKNKDGSKDVINSSYMTFELK
ncbi:uncharacterized protein [Musca autumnalis]|uniref:uncharacterized protein n=1 Tax=Musca autumnalis TaxID=221902 RepID=UPI003CE98FF9